MDGTCNVNGRN